MSSMEGEGTPFIAPSAFHQTPNGLHINTMSHPQIGRNNVSVTNIKCEDGIRSQSTTIAATTATAMTTTTTVNGNNSTINTFFNGGIRISVPKTEDSDSDTELSNIENLKVNRRQNSNTNNGPRPMSWEGELSEPEDIMDTENCTSNDQKFLGNMNTQMSIKSESQNCDIIKPDLDQISVDVNTSLYPPNSKKVQNDPINLKYEPGLSDATSSGLNSPLLARSKANLLPANPSPDSAIHSVYTHSSPSQSPLTSRHAPYTPSLSRNNSDASHSSCYSYSSEFSPTHSPIQGRHNIYGNFNGPLHHSVLYRPILDNQIQTGTNNDPQNLSQNGPAGTAITNRRTEDVLLENDTIPSAGISRQQLINSPCPICGDKISGFHYGIFSCESCKGFFKRTVQNRKNYVCVRGGPCPVTISTRKKCPACRFDKCLQKGMKLEAIREDRTRGGRSTYQCSYTLPNSMLNPLVSPESIAAGQHSNSRLMGTNGFVIKTEQSSDSMSSGMLNSSGSGGIPSGSSNSSTTSNSNHRSNSVPTLLQEIMDVEHLWQYNEAELARLNQPTTASSSPLSVAANTNNLASNPLLASAGLSSNGENTNPDLIANLCNVADHRLYKIVKWCKSLPLFKNISIDDQICLLINSWCELLLFSCCFRSVDSHGEIKISLGKSITLAQAKSRGLQACIERMLNLTDHLRRLRVDRYEYVAMKVIVLLQSDTSELREPVKVRESQEKALQALQSYTLAHYSDTPAKFGELLLRIPELQRTCQLGKEMLTIKSRDGEDFNLLMELLRGEH